MPLQVQEVEKADVPLLEPLRAEAFQNNPIEPFLFPRTKQAMSAEEISNKERERAERVIREWEANPFMKIFKVIDTDLDNEMIAFAMFLVYRNDEEANEVKIRHVDEIESLFGDRVNLEVVRGWTGAAINSIVGPYQTRRARWPGGTIYIYQIVNLGS
ncbi:hypothetical protein V2G26_009776 [Clonostachys chloroleuca]